MPDIHFSPNQPVTLRLEDPEGQYDFQVEQGEYRTCDGRRFTLPRQAVIQLNALGARPGEEIKIARLSKGGWTVELAHSSELLRAQAETALESSDNPSDTEYLLEASLKRENARKRRNGHPVPIRKKEPQSEPAQPRLFDRKGTGTDGPAPAIDPARVPLPAVAKQRVKYQDALRHFVRHVKLVLAEENLQLGDGPTQDLITTCYIAWVNRHPVEYDFTEKEGR